MSITYVGDQLELFQEFTLLTPCNGWGLPRKRVTIKGLTVIFGGIPKVNQAWKRKKC